MNRMEISKNEIITSKTTINQIRDEIKQLRTGLLYVLEAVDCVDKHCEELTVQKRREIEEFI